MRTFLYATLELIKHSEKETCENIGEKAESGLATYLSTKYKEYFATVHPDKIVEADDYFKNLEAEFDNADRKYNCKEDDGLYLVISIALNKIN